ncbi:MAG: zinc finger domain-containing protein, partial [Bacteroidota bacterium]
ISRRKLGSVEITDDTEKYIRDAALGVDATEISEEVLREKLQKNQSAIKSFLMNQANMAGIGNVYSDEILFQAGIYPKKKAAKMTREESKKIYEEMNYVLKTAIDKEADVSEFPDHFLLSHRQEGEKCPGCNSEIQKIKVSGRTGYYCPDCQKKNN